MATISTWPDGFSPSCQTALRFAWAAAAVRTGAATPDLASECTIDDLLVGTMLSHPGTSEAEQCFRHFGLVAGQVLDPTYPRLSADALNRRLDVLTSSELPPMTQDAAQALEIAEQQGTISRDGKVHLPFFWKGILGLPSSTITTRLMTALSTRSVELADLYDATDRWLSSSDKQPYRDVLTGQFPNPQRPTTVANFKADTTDGASSASGDLLQIGREVDAFAFLLASKDTQPPLAIGLFGDWGSGKTFFMDSVRRRIKGLLDDPAVTKTAQGETPFWKKVIPIEFNAWHYAEGELLASLVDHIFTHLRESTYGRAPNPVIAEEQGWLRSLDEKLQELNTKKTELATASDELSTTQLELDVLETERAEALETLDDQVANTVLEQAAKTVVTAARAATERAVDTHMTVGQARAELDRAHEEGTRALASIRWIGRSRWRTLAAVIAVILVPVVVAAVDAIAESDAVAAAAGVAAVGAQALGWSTAFVRKYLDGLSKARIEVEQEAVRFRAQGQAVIDAKVSELRKKRTNLTAKRNEIEQLERERAHLQRQLDTPAGVRIRQFLDERIGSGEYQARLGVPAIVRQDLERLSSYISHENDQIRDSGKQVASKDYDVNRIVLYIDDLDRCSDEKVIEVLQAVHLLLAFELFIVVVAVDSRWLSHALMKKYPALAPRATHTSMSSPTKAGEPGPRDYLEKIFQVPFFVQPLGDGGRKSIVRGLLGDHIRSEGGATSEPAAPVARQRISAPGARVLDEQVGVRQAPASITIEAFGLTPTELEFIESLAPLLGDTPRAVKRFVNVYQLLRVILPDRPSHDAGVSDRQLAAFWLAADNTDADFAQRLVDQPPTTLDLLTTAPSTPSCGPVPPPVAKWMIDRPGWACVTDADIIRVGAVARRFSFGS